MSKTISTLRCPSIKSSERKCGNTTRQVDYAIQRLFQGQTVKVEDHAHTGENSDMNKRLMDLIIERITLEHFRNTLQRNKIKIDRKANTIKIEL